MGSVTMGEGFRGRRSVAMGSAARGSAARGSAGKGSAGGVPRRGVPWGLPAPLPVHTNGLEIFKSVGSAFSHHDLTGSYLTPSFRQFKKKKAAQRSVSREALAGPFLHVS